MILNKYLLQTKDGYIKSTVTKDIEYISFPIFSNRDLDPQNTIRLKIFIIC